jgi:Fur family ferric uptake transcriptional regulator
MEHVPGERKTRQKQAIRNAFEGSARPLSVEEAFAAAQRDVRGLGMATVYRTIRSLVEGGWLHAIDVPGSGTLYELADKGHHHHFACAPCRRVFELEGCDGDLRVKLPRGFRASGHDVTIFGTCANCKSKNR